MQEGQNARQQVVERIRQSTSILVAVGNNPSVDALAASLGLSLMLNKMNKHATAVFSGQTPEVIQFLEPSKTFETNVDALRDFIISLDKEKADRLRYKVEDDVVRIFITPYKTSITDKDLQFSQGDFNVDLIIALGVEKREDLDKAIVAHGRILHDATVITINADNQRSTLGSIDYNDAAASSLCEMLVSMSEAFQQPGILDAQISTALLTGIVANTDRFSNPRTSPRVMTMAAQLMAAGANQQLIATNLEKAQAITAPAAPGPMAKQQASSAPSPMQEEPPKPKKEPGELDIVHEKPADKPAPAAAPAPAPTPVAPAVPAEPEITAQQEKELEEALPTPQVQHNLLPEVKEELAAAAEEEKPSGQPEDGPKAPGGESVNDPAAAAKKEDGEGEYISSHGSWKGKRLEPPTLGGTLNATTEEAHEASVKAEEADRNQKLLTHPADGQPTKSKRSRNRRGKGGNNSDVPAVAAAPVIAAAATPALPAAPAPAPLPPAPQPVVEQPPVAAPEIPPMPPQPEAAPVAPEAPAPMSTLAPVAPAPEPLPAPVPEPTPELPPAPVAEPALAPQPQSAPAPMPEPVQEPLPSVPELIQAPEDDLEALHKEAADSAAEAAAIAQPAESTAGDLDNARAAVSQAFDTQPFNPAGQPLESVGAQPMAPMPSMPVEPVMPPMPQPEPVPEPAPASMPAPDPLQALPPAPVADAAPVNAPMPAAPPSFPGLPPLPPMPPMPDGNAELPPAPDLPGLNAPLPPMGNDAPAPADPGTTPPPAPSDPAQFKIPGA
jgi:hypothetical protein